MNLELAIVDTCGPESCQVKMLSGGQSITARYSALVVNKVKIRPGQMVAVDLNPPQPEVAWRWYRVQVVEATPERVSVNDRARMLDAVQIPGLVSDLTAGEDVWVTGMEGAWEIHDRVSGDAPAHLDRLSRLVLPRIVDLLSKAA